MALPEALRGSGWTAVTARQMFPLLVWCAQQGKKITYGQMDTELQRRGWGHHVNVVVYGHPAGAVGNACIEIEREIGEKIPPLNALIVNAKSRIPGTGCDYYLATYLDKNRSRSLTDAQSKAMAEETMEEVWRFQKWDEILNRCGLKPIRGDIPSLHSNSPKKTPRKRGWSTEPESAEHHALKKWVAENPQVLGSKIPHGNGKTEWLFASADRVDVMFEHKDGCIADAETVRLIYRLALHGDGAKGQMGVKNIVSHLNRNRIFTRDGGRWGIGQVHRILTRRTYMGEHEFNKRAKSKELKPVSEIVVVPVPPLIDRETFDAVQALLKARHPTVTPSAVISGPTMLTGLIHCAKCGGAMTIRTGKGGRYRYYACSMKARQGPTACEGMAVPMDTLDDLVASHLEDRLLQPERLETILATVLDRRQERSERQHEHIGELNRRAAESEARLKRLYDAIEAGVADLKDPALKDRIDGLKAIRDQAKADAERAQAMLENSGSQAVTPQMLSRFAHAARQRIRLEGGGYRRDHLRALAQRVEVADGEVRIMGSKSRLLQVLTGKNGVNSLPTQGLKWRRECPSDTRPWLFHAVPNIPKSLRF